MSCNLIVSLDSYFSPTCISFGISTGWNQIGLNSYCTDLDNANVLSATYPTCFNNTAPRIINVTTSNVTEGSLDVIFDGNLLGTITTNTAVAFYLPGTAIPGAILSFQPNSFTGCLQYALKFSGGWVGPGWIPTVNGFCHIPGEDPTLSSTDVYLIPNQSYFVSITITGPLIIHIGGLTYTFTQAGTYTFGVTASIEDIIEFEVPDADDDTCITAFDVCCCNQSRPGVARTRLARYS